MPEAVISVAQLSLEPRPPQWQPPADAQGRFDASRARLGDRLGLSKLGVSVTEVAPGHAAYPFHSHRANDELFYVLSGSGVLRLGERRLPVQAGDLIGCPAGDAASAHQLIAGGSEPLRYLAISSQQDPEICEYPDSGKVGAYHGDDENGGLAHLSRRSSEVDYWDGE